MKRNVALLMLALGCLFVVFTARAQEPEAPPARPIPGVDCADPFPRGCVECHDVYPEMNLDTRISVLMKQWNEGVGEKLLAKAQAAAPDGVRLKGKHPVVDEALADIPMACLECHGKDAKDAPVMARMVHLIHLTGGQDNHFMTLFQGECTYCHKLDVTTGRWSMPSGPER